MTMLGTKARSAMTASWERKNYYDNGNIYEGEFTTVIGKGTDLLFSQMARNISDWLAGKQHGRGVYSFPGG